MVRNTGTTIITQPDMYYFVNGLQMAREPTTMTLNPDDSMEYTFNTTTNFTPGAEYHIAAMIDAVNDQASSDDVASVVINSIVGINEIPVEDNSVALYPNPTTGEFTLVVKDIIEKSELLIYDILGKNVLNVSIPENQLTKGFKLSAGLDAGTYIVEVRTSKRFLYKKLTIQ